MDELKETQKQLAQVRQTRDIWEQNANTHRIRAEKAEAALSNARIAADLSIEMLKKAEADLAAEREETLQNEKDLYSAIEDTYTVKKDLAAAREERDAYDKDATRAIDERSTIDAENATLCVERDALKAELETAREELALFGRIEIIRIEAARRMEEELEAWNGAKKDPHNPDSYLTGKMGGGISG